MSAPKRRLQLASLTTLEDDRNQQPQTNQRLRSRQQSREKFQGQESKLPREHCSVDQILYAKDMYVSYPAWMRVVVNYAYLPLFRFLHKWLKLFPPTRLEPDGTYSWVMHQGCFLSEEDALRDAARYAHGYVIPNMPLGRSLTSDLPARSAIYFSREKPVPPVDLSPVMEEADKLKTAVHLARMN